MAEWYVLSIPGQWPLPANEVPGVAKSQSVGDPRGAADLKSCEVALNNLINQGLLQVVNRHVVTILHKTMSESEYGVPVYGFPRTGDVDFTEKGAAMFRGLSDHLYGQHWFSEAFVEEDAHHNVLYTRLRSRADIIVREAKLQGQSASLTSVGPWCIYWWNVLPSGWKINLARVEKL